MGKPNKKHVAQKVKQKHPKNKATKSHLVFDEHARQEFLTGFRKRKTERRQKAHEEMIKKLKDQKRKVREQKRTKAHEEIGDLSEALDWQNLTPSETYNLSSHTVTVTDVTDIDFVGSGGFMLGANASVNSESKDDSDTEITSNAEQTGQKEISKTQTKKTKLKEKNLKKKLQKMGSTSKKKKRGRKSHLKTKRLKKRTR